MKKYKKVNVSIDPYIKFIYDDVANTLVITSLNTNPLEIPLAGSTGTTDYNQLTNKPWTNTSDPFGVQETVAKPNANVNCNDNILDGVKGLWVSVGDSQDYGLYFSDSLNWWVCKPASQGIKMRGLQQLFEAGSPIVADGMPSFAGSWQFEYTRSTDGALSKKWVQPEYNDIGYCLYTPYNSANEEVSLDVKIADKEYGLYVDEGDTPIVSDPCPSSLRAGNTTSYLSLNLPDTMAPNATIYFWAHDWRYYDANGSSIPNITAFAYESRVTFYDSSQNVLFEEVILGNQIDPQIRVPYNTHQGIVSYTITNGSGQTLQIEGGVCWTYQNNGGLKSVIPAAPTSAGNYKLRCIVDNNGNTFYEWVSDS